MSSVANLEIQLPLFCKPFSSKDKNEILFTHSSPQLEEAVSFRSLNLRTDLDLLYDWVNQPYSRKFWQLNCSKIQFQKTYDEILKNPFAHSFIGLMKNEPVCQIDLYVIAADELKDHFQTRPTDCGFHLLMVPPRKSRKGLSLQVLRAFFKFFFSFPEADRLYAEPDQENAMANLLAKKAGLHYIKPVLLSYKIANLYSITKSEFYEQDQIN